MELKQFQETACNTEQETQNAEIQTNTIQVEEKACETEQDQESGHMAGTDEISTVNPQVKTFDIFRCMKKEQADILRDLCE